MTKNREEIEKAVRVVAEYEYGDLWRTDKDLIRHRDKVLDYATNLNSLVTVWEKIKNRDDYLMESNLALIILELINQDLKGESVKIAALLATAKCIESLRNERTENTGGLE